MPITAADKLALLAQEAEDAGFRLVPIGHDAIAQTGLEDGLRLHEFIKGAGVDGRHPRNLAKKIRVALATLSKPTERVAP